jgi:hypothetical protein
VISFAFAFLDHPVREPVKFIMRVIATLFALVAAALVIQPVAAKTDLPADAKLRVGVKFRPDDCERKTKPGDQLSMHYTVRGSAHDTRPV